MTFLFQIYAIFFIFFRHIFASTLVVVVCNVQNILQNRKYLFVFLTHFMYSKLLSQMPSFHIKGFFLSYIGFFIENVVTLFVALSLFYGQFVIAFFSYSTYGFHFGFS